MNEVMNLETGMFYQPTVHHKFAGGKAGSEASKSGQEFEKVISFFFEKNKAVYGYGFENGARYKDYYGFEKNGDFTLYMPSGDDVIRWHIEAKQLGNMESHYEKLSFVEKNLVEGSYGDYFMLIYDHNISSPTAREKMRKIERYWTELRASLLKKGIRFIFVPYNDLKNCLSYM